MNFGKMIRIVAVILLLPSCLAAATFAADIVPTKATDTIRIALLHLDARPGDVEGNRSRIEAAIREAAARKADWIVTPELAETGYGFAPIKGTGWIEEFPSHWIRSLAVLARQEQVALFVGMAEKDGFSGRLYNSVAVIGREGTIQGTYRKHRVVNGPSERWATPGTENTLFTVDSIPVGILICADAYKPDLAGRYRQQGAKILLSPANWPPVGDMGPNGYWEARTLETGLSLVVANRTGKEPDIDFSAGESAIVAGGRKLMIFTSGITRIIYVDWDVRNNRFNAPDNGVKSNFPQRSR